MGKRQTTKERIVDEARRLFNEQGYENVTTAALAAHLGMAEGNLWYHFKTKRALLDAIGAGYAEVIERRLRHVPSGDAVASYAALLDTMISEFRAYRFLYRDQRSYGQLAQLIELNARNWTEQTFTQLEAHLAALRDEGLLDWPRAGLRDVAINATIILRYGLEHFREMGIPVGEGSGAVRLTLLRHLSLFEHRLDPAAAERLHTAIERIGQEALAA